MRRCSLCASTTVSLSTNQPWGVCVCSEGLDPSRPRQNLSLSWMFWLFEVQIEYAAMHSSSSSSSFSLPPLLPCLVVLLPIWQQSWESFPISSNRCWINNENHIRKQPQWPWEMEPSGNMQYVQAFLLFFFLSHLAFLSFTLSVFAISPAVCLYSHRLWFSNRLI